MISPPYTVCVTTLPCEILITALFMFSCIKQSTFTLVAVIVCFVEISLKNNFKRIVTDEYCLFSSNG